MKNLILFMILFFLVITTGCSVNLEQKTVEKKFDKTKITINLETPTHYNTQQRLSVTNISIPVVRVDISLSDPYGNSTNVVWTYGLTNIFTFSALLSTTYTIVVTELDNKANTCTVTNYLTTEKGFNYYITIKLGGEFYISQYSYSDNLIKNGDFFEETGGNPNFWGTDAWQPDRTLFQWESSAGRNSSPCVTIDNTLENDANYHQIVNVEPGQLYELTGYIKGDNIVSAGGVGACIGIKDTWLHTDENGSKGTFDWKKVSLTFIATSATIDIVCRLGWWGSTPVGKAYFDDITLAIATNYTRLTGSHINLMLETADISGITPANLSGWLSNLDTAYIDYAELVGDVPYHGSNILIQSVRSYPGGWAVAGNPILWYQPYVAGELVRVNNKGDWSFGIMHEIGHNFDLDYKWVWNAEFWANLKMYYVIDKRNGKIVSGNGTVYRGSELKNFYSTKGNATNLTGDYMVYRFISVFETIGWNAVKNTFRYYNTLDNASVPATSLGKFNFYLDNLSSYSGTNIRSMFTPEELGWMETNLVR